jgi:hypothetical protein
MEKKSLASVLGFFFILCMLYMPLYEVKGEKVKGQSFSVILISYVSRNSGTVKSEIVLSVCKPNVFV